LQLSGPKNYLNNFIGKNVDIVTFENAPTSTEQNVLIGERMTGLFLDRKNIKNIKI